LPLADGITGGVIGAGGTAVIMTGFTAGAGGTAVIMTGFTAGATAEAAARVSSGSRLGTFGLSSTPSRLNWDGICRGSGRLVSAWGKVGFGAAGLVSLGICAGVSVVGAFVSSLLPHDLRQSVGGAAVTAAGLLAVVPVPGANVVAGARGKSKRLIAVAAVLLGFVACGAEAVDCTLGTEPFGSVMLALVGSAEVVGNVGQLPAYGLDASVGT
jgi:hypothetical protein